MLSYKVILLVTSDEFCSLVQFLSSGSNTSYFPLVMKLRALCTQFHDLLCLPLANANVLPSPPCRT